MPRRAAWGKRSRCKKSHYKGERDGQPGEGIADPEQGRRRRRLEAQTEKHGRDRQALNDRLELARHPSPERLPLAFQVAAQSLNQELTDDDGGDHPGHDSGAGNRGEVDVTARNDHLVDQGVELAADGRVLFQEPGEVAVERIGHRGDHEQRQRREERLVFDQYEHANRQCEPADGQRVGDVPEPPGRRCDHRESVLGSAHERNPTRWNNGEADKAAKAGIPAECDAPTCHRGSPATTAACAGDEAGLCAFSAAKSTPAGQSSRALRHHDLTLDHVSGLQVRASDPGAAVDVGSSRCRFGPATCSCLRAPGRRSAHPGFGRPGSG